MSSIFLTIAFLPAVSPIVSDLSHVSPAARRINRDILHCTKMSRDFFALQYGRRQSHPPSGWKSEAGGGQKGRKNSRKPPFLPHPIALPRHDRGVSASHEARRGRGRGKYHAADPDRSP